MRDYGKILDHILDNNDRISKGLLNSVPLPFERFSDKFKGIVPGKYYCVTAGTHGGKTKFSKFLTILNSYSAYKAMGLDFRVVWFALEESIAEFEFNLLSTIIYVKSGGALNVSATDLTAMSAHTPTGVLEVLKTEPVIAEIYEDIRSKLTIIDHIYDAPSMVSVMEGYMKGMGTFTTTHDEEYNEKTTYTRNPEYKEIHVMVVIDHFSLLADIEGLDNQSSLRKSSGHYFNYRMKKQMGLTVINIQQQAFEGTKKVYQQGKLIEALLEPSLANLGDCKVVARDYDVVFGLFNPAAFDIQVYRKRDISDYEGNAHWLIVLKDRLYGTTGTYLGMEFVGAPGVYSELPKLINQLN